MSIETKLERFISSFKTETELRSAVLCLLERIPNTKNVRETHGTNEIGKDIVFDSVGPFGKSQLVACVIKNHKISGSADSTDGARNVYHQADQALDTPLPRVADGSDERVAQVFIISPYECPPSTVDSIKGKLQASRGKVTFLCGRELLDQFEAHYPQYLIFQSGLYGTYIAELEKRLDSDPAVMSVLFQHGFLSGPNLLTDLYVRPRFSRELYRHQMKSPVIDPHDFLKGLSLNESQSLQKEIRDISRLISAITMPSSDGATLKDRFEGLAIRIASSWQKALETHRRRLDISVEERTKPKNFVYVTFGDAEELKMLADDLLTSFDVILEDFRKVLRSANACAENKFPTVLAGLKSSSVLDYCAVESVARQAPSAVQADTLANQTWELDEDLIDSSGSDLFITAPAGFGKTSFCKWQTIHELKNFKESKSNLIPIYIPLHQHSRGELGSFELTFLVAPELIALWENRGAKAGTKCKFRLYLDGLDEVPSVQRQKDLIDLALKAKEAEPTLSIVVTGREHVVGTHLRRFVRIRVRDFDDSQINELAAKWFHNDEHSIKQFFSEMEKVPTLRPLMRVPLLATLIFGVYRNTKTLPQSRVSLYGMFVSLLAGGWDTAKNIQRQAEFGQIPKLTVLTKLAGTLHKNRRVDCTQTDFKNAVDHTLPGLREQWQRILEETVHDGVLIPMGLNYAFAHLSFQEYLAAKELFEPTGRKAVLAFKSFLEGDEWWREVAMFYIGLSNDPQEIEGFIRKSARTVISKTANGAVKTRAEYLLEGLIMSFPGAQLAHPLGSEF